MGLGGGSGCVLREPPPPFLVLSYTRHWLGERSPLGRAAALLAGCPPPTTSTTNGPAVRCRSSPEFPFRFIWVLGWSTWYLWPIKS
jgi:hypothetical protein